MYETLTGRLKNLAKIKLDDNGMGTIPLSAEGFKAIKEIAEEAADAIEELSKPRWFPVTEKPPKAYEEVLLLFPHNQAVGFCDRDGYWGVYSGDGFYTEVADNEPKPTHWARKLPEPPKEEETNV